MKPHHQNQHSVWLLKRDSYLVAAISKQITALQTSPYKICQNNTNHYHLQKKKKKSKSALLVHLDASLGNETYDADYGGVELDVAETAELLGFTDQVLGLRETKPPRYLGDVHLC